MNSTSTGPNSSLSSATYDCGLSFHPSHIPSHPVASLLVPCWDSSGADSVCQHELSQYHTNILLLRMLVSWQIIYFVQN